MWWERSEGVTQCFTTAAIMPSAQTLAAHHACLAQVEQAPVKGWQADSPFAPSSPLTFSSPFTFVCETTAGARQIELLARDFLNSDKALVVCKEGHKQHKTAARRTEARGLMQSVWEDREQAAVCSGPQVQRMLSSARAQGAQGEEAQGAAG